MHWVLPLVLLFFGLNCWTRIMTLELIKKCKDNANEAQFVPLEVENNMKWMSMEQGLYAQVVKLRRKDFKFTAENENKNEAKSKFQGQYERLQRCFDIDFDQIGVNFSPREPGLYKKFFQRHENIQDKNTLKYFRFQ